MWMTCPAVCWDCQCTDGIGDSGQSAIGCVAEESACDQFCQDHGGSQSFECDLRPCVAIPAVSEWGITIMILLMITAGTLILTPRTGFWPLMDKLNGASPVMRVETRFTVSSSRKYARNRSSNVSEVHL